MRISEKKRPRHLGFAMVRWLGVSFALASALSCASSHAQTPTGNSAVQQARLFNERPGSEAPATGEQLFPPLESLAGGESGADADVGEQWMLKASPRATPFTARVSLSLFGTSNVALSRRSPLSDAFAVADVAIGYKRALAQDWAFSIDLQQSFFRYDRNREFDFESSSANVALSHQARQLGNIVFSLQYGFSRLTSGAADDQLYLGNTIALAAVKVVPVTSAGSVDFNAALGYTFSDAQDLERAELRFALGYTLQVVRNVTASAVARLELYDYTNEQREDLLEAIALGARWDLNAWLSVSASVSIASNISTEPVFSYETLNSGVTLTAHVRF